jgi:NitT/TauT family transport system substrate-binding protein
MSDPSLRARARRTLIPAVALLGSTVLLAACSATDAAPSTSGDSAASSDAIADGGTIRLLVNPTGTQSFPPYVIEQMGLDEKYGFDLQVVESTDTATVYRSGGGDALVTSWNAIQNYNSAGNGTIGVAPFTTWVNTVVVPSDSDIDDIGDIPGHTLGLFGRTSSDWFILDAYAQQEFDVDLESESTLQENPSPALLRGLLEQGQLDVTQMYNDLTPAITAGGDYTVLATIQDMASSIGLPDEAPYLMYAFTTDYVDANPDEVEAFTAAYREAIGILMDDDEPWTEQAAALGITDPDEVQALIDLSRPVLLSEFSDDAEEQIQDVADVLIPLAGETNLGFSSLADPVVTLDYQD